MQILYERYASLELSFQKDRPVAIRGLERRLIRTLKTDGGHGIFYCYLHRCLLWQRSDMALKRIDTFRDETTPSWSWMAHAGGIKYMDIPFGTVSWAEDIASPWSKTKETDGPDFENEQGRLRQSTIIARAWELNEGSEPENLVLDDPTRTIAQPLKFVIIGTEKAEAAGSRHRKVYVLVVTEAPNEKFHAYERVGVGVLDELTIGHQPAMKIGVI